MAAVALLFVGPVVSQDFGEPCPPLVPLGPRPLDLQLGIETVSATSCGPVVEVNGTSYLMLGGSWLDEHALVGHLYGVISRASPYATVYDQAVYSLEGVDPAQLLISRADPAGPLVGPWVVLWGDAPRTREVCRYAAEPIAICASPAP